MKDETLIESIVRTLYQNGPMTWHDLLGRAGGSSGSVRYRGLGIQKFDLPSGRGVSTYGGGPRRAVYYFPDEHDPSEVIDAYFEANPKIEEEQSDWALHQQLCKLGDEWREASYERFAPFDSAFGGGEYTGGSTGGICPRCGDEYDGHLPAHLRSGCSAE